ncbi:hypothetical protein LINPERHAP2_LOCUS21698 [Linum perenne]
MFVFDGISNDMDFGSGAIIIGNRLVMSKSCFITTHCYTVTGLIQNSKCYLRSLESGMEGFGKKQLLINSQTWMKTTHCIDLRRRTTGCVGYRLDGKSSQDLGHTTKIQTCFIWIKLRRIERSWRLRRIERSWRPRRIERRWICLNLYYLS